MHSLIRLIGLATLATSTTYAAIGPTANVYIGNKVIAPDGFNRSAVLAGSTPGLLQFPAPLIRGIKGDTFRLNVIDNLVDTTMQTSTSIHWHGLFQRNSSWADGPAGVTQCPISPNHSFEYVFSSGTQAGTYWYHSHYSTQYCDGLRGAMVVYDPADPHRSLYDFDDETTVITLADWYHLPSPQEVKDFPVPTSDATLINGLGRSAGLPAVPLAVIRVLPNKRYRFRLVSIACDPNFEFSIDGHTMTIIEVEGQNVQPYTVNQIQIYAGQRYSFVLTTSQPISNYWIRADPNNGATGSGSAVGGINSAILRYFGAPILDPTTAPMVNNPMLETNLHPLTSPAAPGIPTPGAADVNINFVIGFTAAARFTMAGTETFSSGQPSISVASTSFVPPTIPVLLQILSGANAAQDLMPAGSVYVLPPNKVIEISIPGGSTGSPHPFHLHGHAFSVVRSANSSVYNYANPVRRDVFNTGLNTSDNATIRFMTDNAGPWIMHCHIDWHLDLGLAVVFAEDVPTIKATSHPPAAWDQLCPIYNALPPDNLP